MKVNIIFKLCICLVNTLTLNNSVVKQALVVGYVALRTLDLLAREDISYFLFLSLLHLK